MHARLGLCALVLAGGCAARTAYVPEPALAGSSPAAVPYAPGGNPQRGLVRVHPFAGERLPVGPGAPLYYLRIRLEADNRQDGPWLFNPNDQLLAYNGGMLAPAYVQTSAGRPVLALGPGAQGWMDLFFPLPPDSDPPKVTLWWRFRRGGETTAHTTAFVLASSRDEFAEDSEPIALGLYMPGAAALGWWWPEAYDYRYGYQGGWHAGGGHEGRGTARASTAAGPEPSSSGSSGGGNWRGASAGDGPSSSGGGEGKSAWRGGH